MSNQRFLHLHHGELAVHLIIILLPLYLVRFSFFGLPLNALDVLVSIAFLYVLYISNWKLQISGWKGIMLSFLLIGIVSTLFSSDPIAGLGQLKSLIILPMLVGALVLHSRPPLQRIINSLSILLGFTALIALVQWLTGYGIPAPWNILNEALGSSVRATSYFEYPNAVGLLLAPIVAMLLAWTIHETSYRNFYGLLALLGLLTLVIARTDGAVVAVLAAAIVSILQTRWRYIAIVLGIVALGIGLSLQPVQDIIFFQDASGEVRLAVWQGSIELLKDKPLLGSGLAGFPIDYPEYKLARHVEILQYAHNILLDFWIQLGIAGVIWLLYVLLQSIIRLLLSRSAHSSVLLAGIIAVCVYGLVDVPYFKNDLAILFWILITMSYVITYRVHLTENN